MSYIKIEKNKVCNSDTLVHPMNFNVINLARHKLTNVLR